MRHVSIFSLIFLITLAPVSATAQLQPCDTLNQTTAEGKRAGWWIFYYKDGSKKEEGVFNNGVKEGIWTAYHPNGRKKHEITFTSGTAKGAARFFYEDGTLREAGFWNETCWTGTYQLYYANGQKAYEWHYNDQGHRTGIQKYFHPNGEVKYQGNWEDGKIAGNVTVFDETGHLTATRQYTNGSFNISLTAATRPPENQKEEPVKHLSPFNGTGQHTIYRMDGQIEKAGYFRDGQLLNGKHYIYNDRDSLIEVREVENE